MQYSKKAGQIFKSVLLFMVKVGRFFTFVIHKFHLYIRFVEKVALEANILSVSDIA